MKQNFLPVAVGILFNEHQEVLVAKRLAHQPLGGLWEFPGGKIESNETPYAGLCRELREEIGIEVSIAEPILDYDYEPTEVNLKVWLVKDYAHEPQGCEGQILQWVTMERLQALPMLPANQLVIAAIKRILSVSN